MNDWRRQGQGGRWDADQNKLGNFADSPLGDEDMALTGFPREIEHRQLANLPRPRGTMAPTDDVRVRVSSLHPGARMTADWWDRINAYQATPVQWRRMRWGWERGERCSMRYILKVVVKRETELTGKGFQNGDVFTWTIDSKAPAERRRR